LRIAITRAFGIRPEIKIWKVGGGSPELFLHDPGIGGIQDLAECGAVEAVIGACITAGDSIPNPSCRISWSNRAKRTPGIELPDPPPTGDLNIQQVLSSAYFFA
jgi:hypothetical protein